MAGFIKQFFSVYPASGVCMRLEYAFSKQIVKPDAECFTALVAAWEEAIQPYEQQEPALYQMHQTHRLCDDVCKVFALSENHKSAAHCAGEILGSLCYPPFAQAPSPRSTWYLLLTLLEGISKNIESNNLRFTQLNPKASALFAKYGRDPFIQDELPRITDFVFNWAAANNVKWR